MLPVVWLETALHDLAAVTEFIADKNPIAATNAIEILNIVHSRQQYP